MKLNEFTMVIDYIVEAGDLAKKPYTKEQKEADEKKIGDLVIKMKENPRNLEEKIMELLKHFSPKVINFIERSARRNRKVYTDQQLERNFDKYVSLGGGVTGMILDAIYKEFGLKKRRSDYREWDPASGRSFLGHLAYRVTNSVISIYRKSFKEIEAGELRGQKHNTLEMSPEERMTRLMVKEAPRAEKLADYLHNLLEKDPKELNRKARGEKWIGLDEVIVDIKNYFDPGFDVNNPKTWFVVEPMGGENTLLSYLGSH